MGVSDTRQRSTDDNEPPLTQLTAFQRDCLFAIARLGGRSDDPTEAPHGLAIKSELEDAYGMTGNVIGGDRVNHGRLYPNLDALVEEGLVEKGERDRRTNTYALTDKAVSTCKRQVSFERKALAVPDPDAGDPA